MGFVVDWRKTELTGDSVCSQQQSQDENRGKTEIKQQASAATLKPLPAAGPKTPNDICAAERLEFHRRPSFLASAAPSTAASASPPQRTPSVYTIPARARSSLLQRLGVDRGNRDYSGIVVRASMLLCFLDIFLGLL